MTKPSWNLCNFCQKTPQPVGPFLSEKESFRKWSSLHLFCSRYAPIVLKHWVCWALIKDSNELFYRKAVGKCKYYSETFLKLVLTWKAMVKIKHISSVYESLFKANRQLMSKIYTLRLETKRNQTQNTSVHYNIVVWAIMGKRRATVPSEMLLTDYCLATISSFCRTDSETPVMHVTEEWN